MSPDRINLHNNCGDFNLGVEILGKNRIGLYFHQERDAAMYKFLDCMIKHAEKKNTGLEFVHLGKK